MTMTYVKLFESILASTIWSESAETRVVWITMLAMADQDGIIEASVPGLAHFARVDNLACERALASFLAPDKDSRTKDYDGRRIEAVVGGWRILNYELYRDMATYEERKEKARLRQERKRIRDNLKTQDVTQGHAESPKVTDVTTSDSDSPSPSVSSSLSSSSSTSRGGVVGVDVPVPSQKRESAGPVRTAPGEDLMAGVRQLNRRAKP